MGDLFQLQGCTHSAISTQGEIEPSEELPSTVDGSQACLEPMNDVVYTWSWVLPLVGTVRLHVLWYYGASRRVQ